MWQGLDFSKLNISFCIGDTQFRLVESKRTLFYQDFPNHMHSFFELHYICAGKGFLLADHRSYPLAAGCLFVVPPKAFHEQLTDTEDLMEEYSFSFDIQPAKNDSNWKLFDQLSSGPLFFTPDATVLSSFFSLLEEEASGKQAGYSYVISGLLEQITVYMLRLMFHREKSVSPPENPSDNRRKYIIDETLIYQYRDITLEQLASYLNLSLRQTSRIIKKEYGMNFLELRRRSRIHAACTMLADSSYNIDTIAEAVGYDNTIFFSSCFKELMGCTPGSYRKTHHHVSGKTGDAR